MMSPLPIIVRQNSQWLASSHINRELELGLDHNMTGYFHSADDILLGK